MKKTILYVAIATMFAACGNGAKNYTLTGKVDTLYNGSYAHLSYGEVNDSVQVVDGSFVFEGRIDTPVFARVMVTKEKERAGGMVVLEAGVPEISLVGDEVICGGSPLNDAYNTYNKKMEEVYNVYRDAYMSLRGNKELSDEERDAEMEKRGEEFSAGRRALNTELFAANTNNALGAVALLQLARDNEQFDSLYNAAGEIVRADSRVVKEKQRYENLAKTAAGKMFTDFTIEHGAADGSSVSLSDYVGRGKYVLVDFWASWCGPCRGEMPNLAEVYKKYKGEKFEIVGVAVWDERADTEKAMKELPITWPVIYDAQELPTDIYGINGIPQIILFGPDGTIVARDLRGEKIGEKVGECLSK